MIDKVFIRVLFMIYEHRRGSGASQTPNGGLVLPRILGNAEEADDCWGFCSVNREVILNSS